MNSPPNTTHTAPIPWWQQTLICSVGCASVALAGGYMLGKGSEAKAPPASYQPEVFRARARMLPRPIDIDAVETYMPPAREDNLEQVSSGTATSRPSELPSSQSE